MTRVGRWRVDVCPGDRWTAPTWTRMVTAAMEQPPVHSSKHARTYRCEADGRAVFVKAYHHYGWATRVKDLVRASKARHVQRISARLTAQGIHVPRVLAVAEDRRGPVVRAAWVATAALRGAPVAAWLASEPQGLAAKRATLGALGAAVGDLHDAGFVAGDLAPSNVWVDGDTVAFLDHDRTVGGSRLGRWWRMRRNLVQLNRHVLPGVTATDRLRVYRAYARRRGWSAARARRRLGWVVAKTIERRQRFDGVPREYAARVSFRELMRAPRPPVQEDGAR